MELNQLSWGFLVNISWVNYKQLTMPQKFHSMFAPLNFPFYYTKCILQVREIDSLLVKSSGMSGCFERFWFRGRSKTSSHTETEG